MTQDRKVQIVAKIVTFGEIMVRMAPRGVDRLRQALPGTLEVTFAGAEANAAVSLAFLGADVDFVTALPEGPLTDACLSSLRGTGMGISNVRQTASGRFGIFFVETGANQRPTQVCYDRDYSAISLSKPGDFDWKTLLKDAAWLHLTGITPALSESAAAVTLEAAQTARAMGVQVSFDVNYRSRLWRWDASRAPQQLARETLVQLLPYVSLMFGNEEDCRLLGIALPDVPAESRIDRAIRVAETMHSAYPNIALFATTFREQISASHNNWGGMLYESDGRRVSLAPIRNGQYQPWEIRQIVDRVGSGDAFDAGILFGLTRDVFDPDYTIEFATAAGCLAHSIVGDWNYASQAEIEELMRGSGTGRVVR